MNSEFESRFSGKHALISGGMGFIGSNLARRLLSLGARVTIVDNALEGSGANRANLADLGDHVRLLACDVRELAARDAGLADVAFIFHLAAQTGHVDSMRDPPRDLGINVLGAAALLEVWRAACPQAVWVVASTRQLYGPPRSLPVAESHPLAPPDVNAVGKLAMEELVGVYARVYGLSAVTLRLTNTYGPRMRIRDARQMFLGLWIGSVLRGAPITVFGDGKQRRDLVFVDDVVDAFLTCADTRLRGSVFNVGSDESTDLRALAEQVCRLGGGASRVEFKEFPAERKAIDIGDYVGDYSAIRAATGWHARTTLDEGLMQTLTYYRDRQAAYLEPA